MTIKRIFTLDLMRTIAILLMVVFHFLYDLKLFGIIHADIPDGDGWRQFRWLIISIFFICLGASLHITHVNNFRRQKFLIRFFQVSAGALVISVGSYYFFRENWIFFGVLHFLALSSILAIPLIKLPRYALFFGIGLLIAGIFGWVPTTWPFNYFLDSLPDYTSDYVAIVPWFGMVLIGIHLGNTRWFQQDPCHQIICTEHQKFWAWPGQHSLSIYLLHQPLLVGLIYCFWLLKN